MGAKIIIIPARFDSSRFPGKPMALINSVPMILHVWNRARKIKGVSKVIVATDNKMIRNIVDDAGGKVVMTSPDHISGTDRIAEVSHQYPSDAVILNLQGDLPFVDVDVCFELIECIQNNPDVDIATPVIQQDATNTRDFYNRNIIKAVFDLTGRALYFSRKSIPEVKSNAEDTPKWHRHIGLYCYRNSVLQKIARLEPTQLEEYEGLEQLRWLENGYHIQTVKVDNDCGPDINCPEDLKGI